MCLAMHLELQCAKCTVYIGEVVHTIAGTKHSLHQEIFARIGHSHNLCTAHNAADCFAALAPCYPHQENADLGLFSPRKVIKTSGKA